MTDDRPLDPDEEPVFGDSEDDDMVDAEDDDDRVAEE